MSRWTCATRSSLELRFWQRPEPESASTPARKLRSQRPDVQANAYTVGQHVFFAAGSYNPHSADGKRLLAHELSHTVQQSGGASGHAARLSSAAPAVQRDPTPQAAPGSTADDKKKQTKPEAVTLPLPSDFMNRFRLTPPSLLTPPQQPSIFSPGQYALGPRRQALPAQARLLCPFYPPSIFPTPTTSPAGSTQPGPTALPASPAGPSTTPAAVPQAPSRVSLYSAGSFSIGARFGFPDLSKDAAAVPGAPPSALQESIKQTEIINYQLNGVIPSAYSVDPGKLIGASWGIFTTLAPGVAAKIASGLASKPGSGGPLYQLDATILFNMAAAPAPLPARPAAVREQHSRWCFRTFSIHLLTYGDCAT